MNFYEILMRKVYRSVNRRGILNSCSVNNWYNTFIYYTPLIHIFKFHRIALIVSLNISLCNINGNKLNGFNSKTKNPLYRNQFLIFTSLTNTNAITGDNWTLIKTTNSLFFVSNRNVAIIHRCKHNIAVILIQYNNIVIIYIDINLILHYRYNIVADHKFSVQDATLSLGQILSLVDCRFYLTQPWEMYLASSIWIRMMSL